MVSQFAMRRTPLAGHFRKASTFSQSRGISRVSLPWAPLEHGMSEERTANAVDRWLGQRVRTRRLEISMSQERLAALLGVTFQQVQKYEKGVNRIAASRLFDIAMALDMPVAKFYDGISPPSGGRKREGEASSTSAIHRALATGASRNAASEALI
jgi:transcriptional regulator with XRE-family HTH domain